jgi:hypothetical protein
MNLQPLLSLLRRPDVSCFISLAESPSVAFDLAQLVSRDGITVRVLAGARMRTRDGTFAEHASALQFPPYFGSNWDAMDECLSDLSWLGAGPFAIFVLDAHLVLDSEDSGVLATVVRGWSMAASAWATQSVQFHIVLQTDTASLGNLRSRWLSAGLDLELAAMAHLPPAAV